MILFLCKSSTQDSYLVQLFNLVSSLFLQEQIHVPIYHPTPSQARLATQLTEEEQVRIAQRIGLIQHLPKGVYDPGRDGSEKKIREWVETLSGQTQLI